MWLNLQLAIKFMLGGDAALLCYSSIRSMWRTLVDQQLYSQRDHSLLKYCSLAGHDEIRSL